MLQSFSAGPRDYTGPNSISNSNPYSSLGASPGLGRSGCHGSPDVAFLAQRLPGVVVSSVPHNMAPLGPFARLLPPKAFTLVPADSTPPSRCSGSLRQEGLPFPHFIARAGAVSVLVRVGVRQRHLPVPECGRGVGGACRLAGHAPMRGRCRPRPLVAMAVKRRCPVPPKLRTGFISVGVTRCMGVALGVVITMGVVTKRGGATIQAGLAHHAARAGRGS